MTSKLVCALDLINSGLNVIDLCYSVAPVTMLPMNINLGAVTQAPSWLTMEGSISYLFFSHQVPLSQSLIGFWLKFTYFVLQH